VPVFINWKLVDVDIAYGPKNPPPNDPPSNTSRPEIVTPDAGVTERVAEPVYRQVIRAPTANAAEVLVGMVTVVAELDVNKTNLFASASARATVYEVPVWVLRDCVAAGTCHVALPDESDVSKRPEAGLPPVIWIVPAMIFWRKRGTSP
jgi:hypothetical protein